MKPCYCGHDCSRCYLYLATVRGAEELREKAREMYKREFGIEVPLQKLKCRGGRSETTFYLCKGCPFKKCCRERGLEICNECPEQCNSFIEYRNRYVNKIGQV